MEGATKQPEMLTRFFAALIHPLIHTGLGVEFNLPGIFAEGKYIIYHTTLSLFISGTLLLCIGLAQTAVHLMVPSPTQIITSSWFLQDDEDKLASQFSQGVHMDDAKTGTHAFTVLARILADPRLELERPKNPLLINKLVLDKAGDAIREYVDQWDLSGDNLDKKLEELLWTNVLIYGVGGSEKTGNFNADFFQ